MTIQMNNAFSKQGTVQMKNICLITIKLLLNDKIRGNKTEE